MANEFIVKNGLIVGGNVVTSGTITINGALAATQSWVTSQAYLTSASLSGYATQSYVTSAISSLIDAAPAALDTLNELAAALGDDPNFATTVSTSIGNKVSKSGDTMSGTLSFQQPVGLSFANGQYIKDNNGGGLIIYSGAAVNINGTSIAVTGAATFSSSVTVGSRLALQPSNFGYASSYKTLLIGSAGTDYTTNALSLAFNVDVSGNPNGAFTGNGYEYIWRNTGSFITPNAANTSYNTLFSWNSSGQLTFNQATTVSSTITASVLRSINSGVDATFQDAFVGVYSGNNNEQNAIQTSVSSVANWSGFKFQASNGGGSAGRTTVVDFVRDRALFYTSVGIGTTGPEAKLHIVSGSGQAGFLSRGTNGDTWFPYSNGQNYVRGVTNFDSGSVYFTGGNIGIGTSSPSSLLTVAGTTDLAFSDSSNLLRISRSSGVARFQNYDGGAAANLNINWEGGNVGIGTSSPSEKLFVNSGGAYMDTTVSYGTNTKGIVINQEDGTGYGTGVWFRQAGLTAGIGSTRVNSGDWATDLRFYTHPSSTTNQNTLYERMRINSEGNVGIGTSSPAGIFNISQDFSVVPFTYTLFDSYGPSTTHSPVMAQRRARGTSTSPTNVLNGDRLGFLGVMPHNGTSFPSLATGVITFVATEDHTVSASGTAFTIATTTNGVSGRTERVRVDHNGNVGIGTTTPDSALEINGRVSIRGANELYFGQSTSGLGSWTTRMYASGSTHKFNASTFIFNNEGYGGSEYMRINSAGKVSIGTTDTNSDKSDFTVYTGGNTTIALAGNLLRVGESDVNWDIALRQNGTLQTYGQTLNLNTQAGNYAVNIQPNGTTVAQFYTDYTYFPGLDFSISRVNGAHASNYFRGDASHLVIGTGGTLHLNFGNTSGNTYISGSTYVNSNLVWHAGNLTNLNQLTNGPGYIAIGSTISDTGSWTNATKFKSSGDISNAGAGNHSLQIFSDTNNDAFIAFHISGDYAVYFGLDDASNRLQTGGWSEGSNKYQIWDSRDFTSANISNWSTAYSWGNHVSAGYLRLNTWEGNSYIATSGAHYGTIFYDSNDTNYYVDPNSTSNLNVLSIPGYQYIGGQTSNGQSNYQWTGATYQTPGDWTARLILRRDNASTGVNGSIPSLVIFNNNGGDQTTASMVFASNECVTGSNSVNLAGIVAKKESVGNCGGWSSGSLNFFVKNYATRIDSLALTPDGNATFSGLVYSTGYGNSSQWNTAYSWGNHASYSYATTSYVTTQINNLINGAPGALDTLSELATALGNDASFATTVTNSIATKLPLAGGTMSGTISFINDIGTALQGTVGINDFWRIYANSTTTNAGYLEIATSDDGTEPIYVRQYTGVFSSLTRTATLLDGAGNTAFPGNLNIGGFLTESSSLKLKENIETSEGNLEKVVNLRPVTYNKIGSQTTELGLIAEEVAEVYPEFVQYDENGEPIGVNYSRLTAALIGAVKELTNQVQELNKKING